MRRRRKGGGQPAKGRRHSTVTPRARKAPTGRISAADLQEKLAKRTRELDEALQQQTATREVLSIIRRSPADAQPVFDAIVESAARLCDAVFSVVYLYEANLVRVAATKNFTSDATTQMNKLQQFKRPDRSHAGGRAILDRAIVHVPDVRADPSYSRELALAGGWRAVLAVRYFATARLWARSRPQRLSQNHFRSANSIIEDIRRSGADCDRKCAAI